MRERGELFVITLRPLPGVEPIRALRRALKALLRYHGLRAVRVEPRRLPIDKIAQDDIAEKYRA